MSISTRPIIVVLGMHRSGTSLCSHLLTRLGYDMGDGQDIHPTNAKGHWERLEFVKLHDRILRHFDRDYYSPNHAFALPPDWWNNLEVQKIRGELVALLKERMGQQFNFGLKDPRICLLLPMWKGVFAELGLEPKYVVCIRDPAQVVRSIADRDKFAQTDSEYRWARYNAHAIAGIGDTQTAFVQYETWFTDPAANLNRLIAHLGSSWSANDPTLLQAVSDVIAPELRHDAAAPSALQAFTQDFYLRLLAAMANNRPSAELLQKAWNFTGVEQLYGYKQKAYADLTDDRDGHRNAADQLRKTETQLQTELQSLKGALEQEKAALAAARQEIATLRPPPPVEAPPPAATPAIPAIAEAAATA